MAVPTEGRFLSAISNELTSRPRAVVLIGGGGLGKTSWCAQWPDPLFICDSQERGIEDLKTAGLVDESIGVTPPVRDWSDLMDVCNELQTIQTDYKTLVFEAVTGLEKFCFNHHCEENYRGDWDNFMNFSKGPKSAGKNLFPKFVEQLEILREVGYHVIVTGHTMRKAVDNAEGGDYTANKCYAEEYTWQALHHWAECVGSVYLSVATAKEGVKYKVTGEGERMMVCELTPIHPGKNRLGIDYPITFGPSPKQAFLNFCKAAKLNPETMFRDR